MTKDARAEADMLKNIIIKTVPAKSIYLFGSYAYGRPNEHSDLDFCVVVPDNIGMREIDVTFQLRKAMRGSKSMPVDLIVEKESDFRRRLGTATLEREISENGVLLYG